MLVVDDHPVPQTIVLEPFASHSESRYKSGDFRALCPELIREFTQHIQFDLQNIGIGCPDRSASYKCTLRRDSEIVAIGQNIAGTYLYP